MEIKIPEFKRVKEYKTINVDFPYYGSNEESIYGGGYLKLTYNVEDNCQYILVTVIENIPDNNSSETECIHTYRLYLDKEVERCPIGSLEDLLFQYDTIITKEDFDQELFKIYEIILNK
jgi:hypothetical protein